MSNVEHLIENAIHFIETSDNPYEALHNKRDIDQAKAAGVSLNDIWLIAQHVYYTLRPEWIEQGRQEIITKHGYE